MLFSYGSGLAATMYSFKVTEDCTLLTSLMAGVKDIPKRLASRKVVPPAKFEAIMSLRQETHHKAPYVPTGSTADLFPSTFYLTSVDDKHRRAYGRVGTEGGGDATQTVSNGVH